MLHLDRRPGDADDGVQHAEAAAVGREVRLRAGRDLERDAVRPDGDLGVEGEHRAGGIGAAGLVGNPDAVRRPIDGLGLAAH
jgi:hypothetical protein